jgi:hypothetical protein
MEASRTFTLQPSYLGNTASRYSFESEAEWVQDPVWTIF